MARDPQKSQPLITVALKEYDALRKAIDDRSDVAKTYGWPVALLSFGAIAGYKSEIISINVALIFIPMLVFTVAALDANSNHDKFRARRAMALVEDRIFILCGGEPLLCHESLQFKMHQEKAGKLFAVALSYSAAYVLLEIVLSLLLLPQAKTVSYVRTFLFIGVLSLPLGVLLYSIFGIHGILSAPFYTLLLKHIDEHQHLEPDGERLIYETAAGDAARRAEEIVTG